MTRAKTVPAHGGNSGLLDFSVLRCYNMIEVMDMETKNMILELRTYGKDGADPKLVLYKKR